MFHQELREFLGEEENEEQEPELASELPESTETEPAVSSGSVKFPKPPKTKKSPLQEAAELSPRTPKNSAKKRKKSKRSSAD